MSATTDDLVPVGQRLRWTAVCRMVLGPAGVLLTLGGDHAAQVGRLGVVWAGWIAVTVGLLLTARRSRRAAVLGLNLSVLGDGILLAATWYLLGGFAGPGTFLLLIHVVSVTLLASFRTGAKVTLWHGLLTVLVTQSQAVGLLGPVTPVPVGELTGYLVQLMVTMLVTACFAAVNERELRRRRYDDQVLRTAAAGFIDDDDPVSVAGRLTRLAREELLSRRAAVLVDGVEPGEAGWALVDDGAVRRHALTRPITVNSLVSRAVVDNTTVLAGTVAAADDPDVARLLPGVANVVCVPFRVDELSGVLLLEQAGRPLLRRPTVERRLVATAEHATYLAAMSLARAELLHRLRRAAQTDGLTGVANRRTFDERLASLVAASGPGSPVSVALVDLDHFKHINDVHGHQTGDDVLRSTAAVLRSAARPGDLVARYGGEEFVLVMPDTDAAAATAHAESIRQALRTMPSAVPVTASMGVATTTGGLPADTLVTYADAALYRAKDAGRDRVVTHQPAPALHG